MRGGGWWVRRGRVAGGRGRGHGRGAEDEGEGEARAGNSLCWGRRSSAAHTVAVSQFLGMGSREAALRRKRGG